MSQIPTLVYNFHDKSPRKIRGSSSSGSVSTSLDPGELPGSQQQRAELTRGPDASQAPLGLPRALSRPPCLSDAAGGDLTANDWKPERAGSLAKTVSVHVNRERLKMHISRYICCMCTHVHVFLCIQVRINVHRSIIELSLN